MRQMFVDTAAWAAAADSHDTVGAAVSEGLFLQSGLNVVMGQEFGMDVAADRDIRRQRPRNLFMVVLALALQQGLVGGILDQSVFEGVFGIGPAQVPHSVQSSFQPDLQSHN